MHYFYWTQVFKYAFFLLDFSVFIKVFQRLFKMTRFFLPVFHDDESHPFFTNQFLSTFYHRKLFDHRKVAFLHACRFLARPARFSKRASCRRFLPPFVIRAFVMPKQQCTRQRHQRRRSCLKCPGHSTVNAAKEGHSSWSPFLLKTDDFWRTRRVFSSWVKQARFLPPGRRIFPQITHQAAKKLCVYWSGHAGACTHFSGLIRAQRKILITMRREQGEKCQQAKCAEGKDCFYQRRWTRSIFQYQNHEASQLFHEIAQSSNYATARIFFICRVPIIS